MKNYGILVCDSSRGRFLACDRLTDRWDLIQEFDCPASRSRVRDLVVDQPGRVRQIGFPDLKAGMEAKTGPKEVEARRFARLLVKFLEDQRGSAGSLVLVAPPGFLGLMRKELTPGFPDDLVMVAKDYVKLDDETLRKRITTELSSTY